jgi:hypothetical protein
MCLVLVGAPALTASSAIVWQVGEWGRRAALTELHGAAAASLDLHATALRSNLEKHRALAFVLARDSDIGTLLSRSDDPSAVERANRKLEALGEGTRATLLQRSPAWAASGRVRPGRAPSTVQGHPSCRSRRRPIAAITSPGSGTG